MLFSTNTYRILFSVGERRGTKMEADIMGTGVRVASMVMERQKLMFMRKEYITRVQML